MVKRFLLGVLLVVGCLARVWADEGDIDLTPPTLGDFDPESISQITLADYPVLPEVTDHARAIYERGQENGRDAHAVSKIGDCMTASDNFLVPFGTGDYDLGDYGDLQPVIDYFTADSAADPNTFARRGLATESGFTTTSVLDPTWADPKQCQANESPLACEFRVSNPAFALIMFGTNDVFFFDEPTFDYYLRSVVLETIKSDVVPVLYTFPVRPEFPDKTEVFNRIIVKIALDYDLPLVNLVAALADLPDLGVDLDDPIHLSLPEAGSVSVFTPDNLQAGYTLRNLITLQALDVLWRDLAESK